MSEVNFTKILESKNIQEFTKNLYEFMNNDDGQMYTYIDNQELTDCNNDWGTCNDTIPESLSDAGGHAKAEQIWEGHKLKYNLDKVCIEYEALVEKKKPKPPHSGCVTGEMCAPYDEILMTPMSDISFGLGAESFDHNSWINRLDEFDHNISSSFPLFFKKKKPPGADGPKCIVNTTLNMWFKSNLKEGMTPTDPTTRKPYTKVEKARVHMDTFLKLNFPKDKIEARFTQLKKKIKEKIKSHPNLSMAIGVAGAVATVGLVGKIFSNLDRIIEVATYGNYSGGGPGGSLPDQAFLTSGLDSSVESIRRMANPLAALNFCTFAYSSTRISINSLSFVRWIIEHPEYKTHDKLKYTVIFWFNLYLFSIKETLSEDVKKNLPTYKAEGSGEELEDYIDTLDPIPNRNLILNVKFGLENPGINFIFNLFKYLDDAATARVSDGRSPDTVTLFKEDASPLAGGSSVVPHSLVSPHSIGVNETSSTVSRKLTSTSVVMNQPESQTNNNAIDYHDTLDYFCFKNLYDYSFFENAWRPLPKDVTKKKEIKKIFEEAKISCLDILFQDIETLGDRYAEIIINLLYIIPQDMKEKLVSSLKGGPAKKGGNRRSTKKRQTILKKGRSSTKKRQTTLKKGRSSTKKRR